MEHLAGNALPCREVELTDACFVSRSLKEQSATIKSIRARLTGALGREPTVQEISRQTGLSPEEIALAETATAATESIQRETGEEGFSLEDVLTDTESEERMGYDQDHMGHGVQTGGG